jgi:hypothetical protein
MVHAGRKKGDFESAPRVKARNPESPYSSYCPGSGFHDCSIGSVLCPLFASGK